MNDIKIAHIIKPWLLYAFIITGFCLLTYGAVQQNYRLSLNDPQIQMAEDVANALQNGVDPHRIVPPGQTVDIASSLSPYLIIYDKDIHQTVSAAMIGGKSLLAPPLGVFEYASANGENRISWEPEPGVRTAIVVRPYKGEHSGFVLVGRSMREVEKREQNLLEMVVAAWIVLLAGSFALKRFT